ncbi:MAG: AAA family ATPase, partial [Planctomycetota bacterium]
HYSWGVIFSDITVEGDLGPALPREIIADRNDLGDPARQLETLLDSYDAPTEEIPGNTREAFVAALAPTFSLVPLLRDRIDEEAAEIVRLTKEQKHALDYCQENHRVAVEGGAGTGKTILAMEKARRLVADGKSVRFLCFNKPLADSLNEEAEGFIATSFHELCHEMALETELGFNVPKKQEEVQQFWNEEAPELLMKALELAPRKRYDAVIIDEGQDFKENWWAAILGLLADRDSSHLYVFHDPNQDIYNGEFSSDLDLTPVNLSYNCRNTVRIAEYCSGLLEQNAVTREDAPEGIPVTEEKVADGKMMAEAVRKLLHRYVNEEGISPERIVILTGKSLKRSPVYQAGKLGNHKLVRLGNERKPNSILIETLHRFKGLESDIAIVCDIDRSSERFNPKKLYVAASRARLVLAVIEYEVEEGAGENPLDAAAVA